LLGSDASESRLKASAPGKRILHLATHGYFFEPGCRRSPVPPPAIPARDLSEANPLLFSGLFLAGANLCGDYSGGLTDDGILTSEEVRALDLAGTHLVVLSACETGLGMPVRGEGIYGLRRAFQMAGSRAVVSALWPVADGATAGMMSAFYDRRDRSIPRVLRGIQMVQLDNLRKAGESDHPVTWGAFISIGDWR
jgi:CHAT domain-containing protein